MSKKSAKGESRRCSALRQRDGKPCQAWALRGPDGATAHDPPLCVWHAGAREERAQERSHPEPREASGSNEGGQLAVAEDDLIISAERGEALYAEFFSAREFKVLTAVAQSSSLQGELFLVRGVLRWLMRDARAGQGLTEHKLERRAGTVFAGTAVLTRMLQVERELERGVDGVPRPIAEALDEIGEEWGIDL